MKKILVVDDDPAILEVIQVILEDNKYEVETSLNGKVFDNLVKRPDLILLDVLLSGEDGRDIIKRLKRSERTQKIPVIMISAHPSAWETVQQVGASDFISKPFDIDRLLETVEKNLME